MDSGRRYNFSFRGAEVNSGLIRTVEGKNILSVDYKKEYLETLKYIEEFAKKTGYPLDFDTKKLAQLIEQAKTPQEAMDLVKKELKLEPILFADPTQVSELQFFSSSRQFAGSYVPSARTVDDKSVALVNGKGAKDEGQYFASIREDYNNMFLE